MALPQSSDCQRRFVYVAGLETRAFGCKWHGNSVKCDCATRLISPFTWREKDKCYTALSGVALPVGVKAKCGQILPIIYYSPIAVFPDRQSCKFLIIGSWMNRWKWIVCHIWCGGIYQNLRTTSPKLRPKDRIIAATAFYRRLLELWIERGLLQDDIIAQLSTPNWRHWICTNPSLANHAERNRGISYRRWLWGAWIRREFPLKPWRHNELADCILSAKCWIWPVSLGGYNFQWAWVPPMLAHKPSAQNIKKCFKALYYGL